MSRLAQSVASLVGNITTIVNGVLNSSPYPPLLFEHYKTKYIGNLVFIRWHETL